jgi:hypothetical protein
MILLSWRRGIWFGPHNLLGAVDQTEDVVEHEVASGPSPPAETASLCLLPAPSWYVECP